MIQRVLDRVRGDAVRGRRIAVDGHVELRARDQHIAGDVLETRQPGERGKHFRRPLEQLLRVGVKQRELVCRIGQTAAYADKRQVLQKHLKTGDALQLRPHLLDHVVRRWALAKRPQAHDHAADVERRAAAAGAHEREHVLDIGISADNGRGFMLFGDHRLETDVLSGLGEHEQLTAVVAGQEALLDRRAEKHGGDNQREEHDQDGRLMIQAGRQRASIELLRARERALAPLVDAPMPRFVLRAQHAAAQHRGQADRDESRDQHRGHDGDRELVEQAADDAAHEHERDEYRSQRQGHRYDREPDLARAVECCGQPVLAHLHVPRDVLEHHDRVVDDKPDGQRQRHQRKVVDAETKCIHDRKRANDRHRQCQRRNHGR